MAELYNLIWVYPAPPADDPVCTSREDWTTLNTQGGVPAIIIYPALTTPAVLVGDQKLELLLLVPDGSELKEEDINRQLKVSPGLEAMKPYALQPLFGQLAKDGLEIKQIPLNENPIKTKDNDPAFSGLLDKRALKLFKDYQFNKLYRVILKNPCPNCSSDDRKLNTQEHGRVQPNEPHDTLVRVVLEKHNGKKLPEEGKYCYEIGSNDIDFCKHPNLSDPLQSYHPVFQFEKLGFAKLGHISDIHINARQNVLRQSKARVIEYTDADGKACDQKISPEIGPMLNSCSENFKKLLERMSDRDILLLGGDFIDHIRNVYLRSNDHHLSIAEIWRRVALDNDYKDKYQPFVDFITFYTLILSFCRAHKVPMFAISGNHDAYLEPYGISPWAKLPGTIKKSSSLKRANEGIPADHNLTIYEAILIFGETFHTLKADVSITDPSPMVPEKLEWFYTLLTPWTDFSVKLPKQHLVGLGWGDDENILDFFGTNHGFGHLPRSEESVSRKQLGLLEDTLEIAHKIVLMTHFTFASYKDDIPQSPETVGFKPLLEHQFSDYDLGTCDKNLVQIYRLLCNNQKIQLIVTGHSHRRGLYTLNTVRGNIQNYELHHWLQFHFYDFCDLPEIVGKPKEYHHPPFFRVPEIIDKKKEYYPLFIVSDSAGPIPRRNQFGEFNGWGSDAASGTQVDFDNDGQIKNIRAIPVSNKPRIAVAMDYWDIINDNNVITEFESNTFLIRDENLPNSNIRYSFSIQLHEHIHGLGLEPDRVTFYCKSSSLGWQKLSLTYSPLERLQLAPGIWLVQESDNHLLRHFSQHRERGLFLAIKFKAIAKETDTSKMIHHLYDLNDYWNFECQIKSIYISPSIKKYIVERDKDCAAEPDFGWRRQINKYLL